MTLYRIVLPKDSPLDHRVLKGIGRLERDGKPIEMELTEAQIRSLKARGINVSKVAPPKPEPVEDDKPKPKEKAKSDPPESKKDGRE